MLILVLLLTAGTAQAQTAVRLTKTAGNPVLPGWYVDPEAAIFGKQYWIYPTFSVPVGFVFPTNQSDPSKRISYNQQVLLDAFSSSGLEHWIKHPRVLDTACVKGARRAILAPAITEKSGKYYLFFAANDIQNDQQHGSIGVAVADNSAGPSTTIWTTR